MRRYIALSVVFFVLLLSLEGRGQKSSACKKEQRQISASLINPKEAGALCLSVADLSKADGGCAKGYEVDFVPSIPKAPPEALCVPKTEDLRCDGATDLLVSLPYPHEWGSVFLPKEVSCGGSFDLFLLLHGTVAERAVPGLMLGGDEEKDRRLEEALRAAIDAKESRPVILADPTDVGRSCELYDAADFDFLVYYRQLHALLAARGVRVRSISASGHSGSGCCTSAGMFRIVESFPKMKLWGTIDACYGSDAYIKKTQASVAPSTILFTAVLSQRADKIKSFQREILGGASSTVECGSAFTVCQKSADKPWYLFLSSGVSHNKLPEPYLREALRRFFAP